MAHFLKTKGKAEVISFLPLRGSDIPKVKSLTTSSFPVVMKTGISGC
jgi:hypothetical protein